MNKVNKIRAIKFVPAAICFSVVVYLMLLPEGKIPKPKFVVKLNIDKWVHVGVFAAIIFLIAYPYYTSSISKGKRLNFFVKIGAAVSLLGLIIEVLQKYFVKGRSFDLWDWACDVLGVGIGFWSADEFSNLRNEHMYKSATPMKLNSGV